MSNNFSGPVRQDIESVMSEFAKQNQDAVNAINSRNTKSKVDANLFNTVYQMNLAKPVEQQKWYAGATPTYKESLGQAWNIYQLDPAKGNQIIDQLHNEQNDPTNPFYQPYLNPTNPAVANLAKYGIDTSNIDDEWFEKYSWLTQYYTYGGTTNSPTKPDKKASVEKKAAYEYWQLWQARPATNAVDTEWKAMQEQLKYWAGRTDMNLSDDEIVSMVKGDMQKKYPTLNKIYQAQLQQQETRNSQGGRIELNRGTDFSEDNMYGVLWAARNKDMGSAEMNTICSAAKLGNQWQENPETAEKLKRSSDKYNPNAVGMTLNEAGLYFGRSSFDQKWVDDNRWMRDSQDETQREMYNAVAESEGITQSAEDQAAAMNAYIDKLIRDKGGKLKAEELLKYLDAEYNNGEYSTLQKMNKAIENGGDPLGLTRAVDFKYAEVQEMLRQKATEEYNKVHALDIAMEYAAGKGADFILHNDWGKTFNDAVNWLSDQAQAILDNRVRNVQQPEEGTAAPEQGTVAPAAPEATVEEPKTFTLKQDEGKTFDTDIGKEGVRNLRNGWKVQDAVKDGASVQSPLDAAQARIAQAKDEKAAAAAAACEPSMNATERNVAAGYSSMSIIASNAISDSVFNMVHKAEQAVVDQSGDDIISGYITNGLAVYPSLDRFERTQDNARNLKAREEELAAELGDKALAGRDEQSRQTTVNIGGITYRVTMADGNNRQIESIEDISSYSVPKTLHTNFYVPDESMLNEDSLAWMAVEDSDEVQDFIDRRLNGLNMARTEEEEAKAKELQQVRMELEDAEDYLRQNKEAYEHDMEIANDAMRQMNNLESILLDAGGDLSEVYEGQIMIRALAAFSDYEATQWTEYNPSSNYATRIQNGEDLNVVLQDAAAEYAEMKEQLADIDFMRKWYADRGIVPPDDYKANVNRAIEKIGRDMKDYEFFITQFSPDFQEKAEEGEKILGDEWFNAYSKNPQMYGKWQLPGQIESAFNNLDDVLSDTEKDIYRYLYALDKENGTNRAKEYASFMRDKTYGVLNVRKAYKIQESAGELTNINLFGFGVANALAVFSSPLNAVANAWDAVDRIFTGRERNPYSPFRQGNIFKNTVREESAKAIESEANKLFGKGTTAAKVANTVAQGAYEIMTMRADSAMNAMTFGWIFGGGPGAEAAVEGGSKLMDFLTQVAQAAPMGISAASDAAAQAKIKGASDTQALIIAAGTFAAETITEGIEIGHITSAFRNAKEAGTGAIRDFLKEWLTDNGVSEMFGETLTDIFENKMDQWVLDDNQHKALVNSYRLNLQVSKEEAEAMALRDEMGDYLRTAIISYLSPGMDILQTYGGKQQYYRSLARDINDNSITRVTARDIRKGEKAYRKEQKAQEQARIEAEQEAKRNGATEELPPINLGALEGQNQTEAEPAAQAEHAAPAAEPAAAQAAQANTEADKTPQDMAKQKALEFLANNKVLTAAQSMERTGADAAVTSVLDIARTSESGDVARATTAGMHTLMEEAGMVDAPAALLQEALEGAQLADIDPSLIRSGMTSAALGGEQSAARQVIMSNEYHQANAEGKAAMLAQAAAADMANEAVQQEISKAVHDNRVAEAECALMAEGAGDAVIDLENQVRALAAETKAANQALETQQGVEAAANEAADRATQEMLANPGDVNTARAQEGAVNQQVHEAAVTDERQQAVENAQQREQEGQQKLDKTRNDTMTTVREQAEANVAQVDQQRAEEQAQAQEQARIEEEQRAQEQAKADEQSGKTWEDQVNQNIENYLDNLGLEGEEREKVRQRMTDRAQQRKYGKINMSNSVNTAEGFTALSILQRKLGVSIQLSNDLPAGARGMYKDGVIYLNNNLIKNGYMTVGQALVEAALHEMTHAMESTKSYQRYQNVVLETLFRGEDGKLDQAKLDAAIDSKIEQYKEIDPEMNDPAKARERALKEIVADFARTNLNDRAVIKRMLDEGLGGRIRNALHNINQGLQNFRDRRSGESYQKQLAEIQQWNAEHPDNQKALPTRDQFYDDMEYLRKAERAYQRAIDAVARNSTHPEGGQFSLTQFAQAAGMTLNTDTLELYDSKGQLVDGVKNKVTADMINNTPVGLLIDMARDGSKTKQGAVKFAPTISAETAQAEKQMFADLMNMVAQYKDSDLVWEIASSTMFSAIKANSDPQYSTTVDFGTVCAKTQEIINVLSRTMLEKKRGLTRGEVLKVYNETAKAGLTVPCPVCYVFSRWMGVPSLLNQMSQYQKRFVATNEDGSIDVKATEKNANDYIKAALTNYGDKEGIDKAKVSLMNRMKTQENNRVDALTVINSETATAEEKGKAQEKHDAAVAELDKLTKDLGEVEAYNWVTQALCKETKKGSGKYVVDPEFQLTPDEVLFDLRQTGEFAKYTKNWKYRNTRGAGMGKAIMPYSGMSIGDIVFGKDRKSEIQNPFLTQTVGKAAQGIKNAITRARQQNLIGGQRLQSTSDFRPEWGLDYMMSFLELQAVGSKVQMYTKVAEAVDLLASMGGDINLSIMGAGQGWHVDENGNKVLDFFDVTGMNYDTAKALKDKYDNVQMILVGMNDTHIRLAMANPDIDFIIPWHSSGNSKDALASMLKSLNQNLETSSDYTDFQTDQKAENRTKEQEHLWNLRMKILQGKKISAEERDTIYHDAYLKNLYDRFNVEGVDADCYKVKLRSDQAKQIFPYEYWDKSLTKDQADQNGKRFVEYCEHFGMVPRFSQFKDDTGYWKLLIDRPMYDNQGNYREQQVVDVTKAKIGHLENGKLVDSDMPLSTSAMYGPNYSEQEKTAVDNALAALDEPAKINGGQYSVFGDDMTDSDIDQMLSDMDEDYMQAAESGDTETAQRMVDEAANAAGYTKKVYHGTDAFGFTEIDFKKSDDFISFFATDSPETADTYAYGKGIKQIKDRIPFTISDLQTKDRLWRTDEGILKYLDKLGVEYTTSKGMRGETLVRVPAWDSSFNDGKYTYKTEFNKTINETAYALYKKYLGRDNIAEAFGSSPQKNTTGVYQLYANTDGFLEIDAKGSNWDDIPFDLAGALAEERDGQSLEDDEDDEGYVPYEWEDDLEYGVKTRYIAQYAKDRGYPGVTIKNVRDNGGKGGSRKIAPSTVYAFFKKSDLKSADPVVYDDDGNVIPLSERFNAKESDFRYSTGGDQTDADIDQMLMDAGVIDKDNTARRQEGNNPSMTAEGEGPQRQFGSQRAQNSDELDQQVLTWLAGHSAYTPDTNQQQVTRAINWIRSNKSTPDSDGYQESLQRVTGRNFNYRTADGQARMVAVMGMAVAKNDITAQIALADAFNRQGTDLGRALQARKIFRLMTPEGRISTLQKMLQETQEDLKKQGRNIDLKFSDWIYQAAAAATEEGDFDLVQDAAAAELADQIPANWRSRLRGWRMLSMLGNPRTHIRNVVGNALFIPAVSMKNKLGAVAEMISRQDERTKTLAPVLRKDIRQFAMEDARAQQDRLTGEAKYKEGNRVRQQQRSFNSRLLQGLTDFNSNALEAEDWFFLRGHYRRALGGWIQANGYTVEQLRNDEKLLEKGRQYAIEEAQRATYRDLNKIAKQLNEISRNGGALGFVTDAVLPFRTTPANILRRGIEYSPVGLIRSLTADAIHLHQYMQHQNDTDNMPERAISPNQFIDRLCAGLTGTGIMVVGALLAGAGAVSTGLDDDDDEFEKLRGGQEYAINPGKIVNHILKAKIFDEDVTFTMDWAAPMSMPFFVGAAIYEQIAKGGEVDIETVANAISGIAEPVFNLSMLDGVSSLLKTTQNAEENITQVGAKILANYLSSYVPSALGATARTVDNTRRKSFVESGKGGGVTGTFRYAWEQIENKIPGVSQTNIPVRDAFGYADQAEFAERILENFVLPGYINQYKDDPVIDELERLGMAPKMPGKTFNANGEKLVLTAEQYDQLTVDRGQTAHKLIEDLMKTDTYKQSSDDGKAEMIADVWTYATQNANYNIDKGAKVDSWVLNSRANPAQGIINRQKDRALKQYKEDCKAKAVQAVYAGDMIALDTCVEALKEVGVKTSSVKTAVGNAFKADYIRAYQEDDVYAMIDIENTLEMTGLGFSQKDFDKWIDTMNQQIAEEEEE